MGTSVTYIWIITTSCARPLAFHAHRCFVLNPRIRVHDRVHAFGTVIYASIFVQIDEFCGGGVARQALSWLRQVAGLARVDAVEVDCQFLFDVIDFVAIMCEGLDSERLCHDILSRVEKRLDKDLDPWRGYVTLIYRIGKRDSVIILVDFTSNFWVVCAADSMAYNCFWNGNGFRHRYLDFHHLLKVGWFERNSVVGFLLLLPIAWSHTSCLQSKLSSFAVLKF